MESFLQAQRNSSVGLAEVESRQFAEMKSKIFLAKQFPRDEEAALKSILMECRNKRLAENAVYEYKRGDTVVQGPSIRLAEVIARHWGNFTCGVNTLEQRDGESTVKAFAWDLETNTSDEKIFTVKHERTAKGKAYRLTDSRDIYEMEANNAARRKRACILSVIPSYIVDEAVEACENTLSADIEQETDINTVREELLNAFVGVVPENTKELLEGKIGKEFDKFNAHDIVKLKHLYSAIRDGFVKPADAFGLAAAAEETVSDSDAAKLNALNEAIKEQAKAGAPSQSAAPPSQSAAPTAPPKGEPTATK